MTKNPCPYCGYYNTMHSYHMSVMPIYDPPPKYLPVNIPFPKYFPEVTVVILDCEGNVTIKTNVENPYERKDIE